MMNSFVDYCKLLPEGESEHIPLETNIREVTELVMAKGKYVPSWAGVVKKNSSLMAMYKLGVKAKDNLIPPTCLPRIVVLAL
jgi:hypothetical protein